MSETMTECEDCEGKGWLEELCGSCNGSGEGCADGTRCRSCKGKGVEMCICETCDGEGEVEQDEE